MYQTTKLNCKEHLRFKLVLIWTRNSILKCINVPFSFSFSYIYALSCVIIKFNAVTNVILIINLTSNTNNRIIINPMRIILFPCTRGTYLSFCSVRSDQKHAYMYLSPFHELNCTSQSEKGSLLFTGNLKCYRE